MVADNPLEQALLVGALEMALDRYLSEHPDPHVPTALIILDDDGHQADVLADLDLTRLMAALVTMRQTRATVVTELARAVRDRHGPDVTFKAYGRYVLTT